MTLFYIWLTVALLCTIVIILCHVWKKHARQTKGRRDDLLAPMVRNLTVGTLLLAFAVYTAHHLGYDIRGALAGLGIGGFILAFSLQPLIKNFLAGCAIILKAPYNPGQYIKVAGHEGVVDEMKLTSTTLKTGRQHRITIPNSLINSSPITNCSNTYLRPIETTFTVDPNFDEGILHLCYRIREKVENEWSKAYPLDQRTTGVEYVRAYCRKYTHEGYVVNVLVYFNTYSDIPYRQMRETVMELVARSLRENRAPLIGPIDVNLKQTDK